MTREQELDGRMFEWLESGPDRAPTRTLDAAVAYARAHPRRRRPWRPLTTRLHVVGLEPWPSHRLPVAIGATAVVSLVLVVGGALLVVRGPGDQPAGGAPPAIPTATTTPAPSPTGLPTPSPLPAPPVAVIGSLVCETAEAGTDSVAGDATQTRGLVLACTGAMSDPRLQGAVRVVVNTDAQPDGSAETWGTATVTGAAGTWTGPWSGTVDTSDTSHQKMTGLYVGSGAYDGLQVRYSEETAGDGYAFRGTLERTDSVPPDGTTIVLGNTCATRSAGTTTAADGVTHYTGVVLDCLGDASDPRLDGQMRVTVDIDERSDESADMRGTFTIIGGDGTWTGSWTGTVAVGYTTHRLEGVIIGSGAYRGLEFRYAQIGLENAEYVMTGVIGATD